MRFTQGGSTPMLDDEERAQKLDVPVQRDRAPFLRGALAALLVVAVVLVALDNRQDVRLGYVFGDADVPVWIAMVAAALAGVIIGFLLRRRPRRRS